MIHYLQGILCHKRCNGSNYRRSHTCFGIIISVWLFHVSVLLIIMPRSFMLVILDFILSSQPTMKGIGELR